MKKNLKEIRIKNGFTQKEIANFFNMPYRTYQNYEEGLTTIPDWVYELMLYKIDKENRYNKEKGIYKIKQIRILIKAICKKYKVSKCILFGEYTTKNVNDYSYIKFLIRYSDKNFNLLEFKKEIEAVLVKNIEIYDINEFDRKSEFIQKIIKKGILVYRSY